MQSRLVQRTDSLQGFPLDLVFGRRRAQPIDKLGFEQADSRLSHGVVVPVTNTSDGRFQPGTPVPIVQAALICRLTIGGFARLTAPNTLNTKRRLKRSMVQRSISDLSRFIACERVRAPRATVFLHSENSAPSQALHAPQRRVTPAEWRSRACCRTDPQSLDEQARRHAGKRQSVRG